MSPRALAVEKGWATWFSMSAQPYRVSGDGLQVSIDVSSPSDFDHEDHENAVVDPVGDPESSDPQLIQALVAGQLLHVQARGIRVVAECGQCGQDAHRVLPFERAQFVSGRFQEAEAV